MPYISKSEKAFALNRERWMSLAEAVDHIQRTEGHQPSEARRQLFSALADRALRHRCGDGRDDRLYPDSPSSWLTAEFRAGGGGEVLCDANLTDEGREAGYAVFRPILVLRQTVLETWKASPPSLVESNNAVVSLDSMMDREKGGRPSSYDDVAAVLERLFTADETLIERLANKSINFKTLADRIRTEAGKAPEDDGWSETTVRTHVKNWRASKSHPD
jgi:hypothetical protein